MKDILTIHTYLHVQPGGSMAKIDTSRCLPRPCTKGLSHLPTDPIVNRND